MPITYGETLSRLVAARIAAPVATTAAITALGALDRQHGMTIIETTGGTSWWFNDASAAPAGPGVLVPDVGTGRWLATSGGAAGVGIPTLKSARARTTGALPANTRVGNVLTANGNGALAAQDGVALVVGNRLLVANEVADANNGPYQVTSIGAGGAPWILTRVGDADASAEVVAGMMVYVSEGTANGNEWFYLTTDDTIVLNTTALVFVQVPSLVDLASTAASGGASLVGIQDAAARITGTTVETATAELAGRLLNAAANEAAIRAIPAAARADGTEVVDLTNDVLWIFDAGSAAGASAWVLVPDAGGGRWLRNHPSLVDLSSVANARGASMVGIEDVAGLITATTVEGALAELEVRLNILDDGHVPFTLMSFRETDATADVSNIAANGGVLASDTTPIMRASANEAQEINWAAANVDQIAQGSISLPRDINGALDVTLQLWVSTGNTNANAASHTVETSWDGAAFVTDTATDGAPSGTIHLITATIAAADIPDAPSFLSLSLIPGAHAADDVSLWAVRLLYTSTGA